MELFVISLLILLGVVLLSVEIALIPGVGITGIMGVLSLISAICYAFVCLSTMAGWITTLIVVVLLAILFAWAVYGNSIDKVALRKKINSSVENPEIKGLKVGDKGFAVAAVQHMLDEISIFFPIKPITVSGVYDDATRDAVSELQVRYLLPVTGEVDKLTWNALVRLYNSAHLYQ